MTCFDTTAGRPMEDWEISEEEKGAIRVRLEWPQV